MIEKGGYTYIMTNKLRTVLYIGVTSDLNARVIEHRANRGAKFTARYKCHYLVYYEFHDHIETAIHREKRLKKWDRRWKDELIEQMNPSWQDLYDSIADMR